jgi:hypothetical protein
MKSKAVAEVLAKSVLCALISQPAWAGFEAANNTAYGSSAGTSLTSGTLNTFVGVNAGSATGAGQRNTFLGHGSGQSNTTGSSNTFIGVGTGTANGGDSNVFIGDRSGISNSTGGFNTFVGYDAGFDNSSGIGNVFIGDAAGHNNQTGSASVFIGNGAGYGETQSQRLYIDNCPNGAPCSNTPFIYGEFDTHRLKINGLTEVHVDGAPVSQLNFSLTSTDTGGYLTSVLDNNFFMSSGARYNGNLAPPSQWVQRSTDGFAVIQGSGGAGYRIFTGSGHAQNTAFAPNLRLHINYSGEFGINQVPVGGHEIHTSSGAYLAAGTWTNASSRHYKENIRDLSGDAAMEALAALRPVTFNYKTDSDWQHVGFIAEDVPGLVASPDRKGLSPMDIVAVLTKVVQEKTELLDAQQKALREQKQVLEAHRSEAAEMKRELSRLAAEVSRLKSGGEQFQR